MTKRINPSTKKPFKEGDKRSDGFRFRYYLSEKGKDGFFKEKWQSNESRFRNKVGEALRKTKDSDLIVTYRLRKKYKTSRIFISWIYNVILRFLFKTKFKDISAGSRLIKKSVIKKINLISNSPFLGAELAIKSKYKGLKVSEVGIHTYPRTFGTGSSVSLINIFLTIKEMLKLYIKIKI